MAPVKLGERAVVSQGVHLCTGSHDYESECFQLFALPILIGADSWICADAFLAPGVSIGDGAVIGARAVVTCDQPQWSVCAGNPCRPIKNRKHHPKIMVSLDKDQS
jgi:putative colanic acid biosynthesis acetyltransferase WcaF